MQYAIQPDNRTKSQESAYLASHLRSQAARLYPDITQLDELAQ